MEMYRPINEQMLELFGRKIRPSTISEWCVRGRDGVLFSKAIKLNGRWHAKPDDLIAWLEETSTYAKDSPRRMGAAIRTPSQRLKDIERAEGALKSAGI